VIQLSRYSKLSPCAMCGGNAAGGKGEAAIVEKLTFSDTATWRNKAGHCST
jgi:hypothetical protein